MPASTPSAHPVDLPSARRLARTLTDHPYTFEARCLLERGLASAYVEGPVSNYAAAIVQLPWRRDEPMAFGTDPQAVWSLLRRLPGWFCVNLSRDLAPAVARTLERELGTTTQLYGDVYYILDRPAVPHAHPWVRRLTAADVERVDQAPPELRVAAYPTTQEMLEQGAAAGAVVDGRLLSIISLSAASERYGDVGGHTLEPWRNRGLGCAATYLVATEVQRRGLVPVWSTGEDNYRSQRVATKVGFFEFGRMAYVVAPALRASGGFRPAHLE